MTDAIDNDVTMILQFSCGRRSVSDEPGEEMGPTIRIPEFVELTYSALCYEGGNHIAVLNDEGDWEIVNSPWTTDHVSETYSDVTIFAEPNAKDVTDLMENCQKAADAAYGDSNDNEIELLRDSLELALDLLGLKMPDGHDPDDGEDNDG